jgi:hypothetical protein
MDAILDSTFSNPINTHALSRVEEEPLQKDESLTVKPSPINKLQKRRIKKSARSKSKPIQILDK